MHAPFANPQSPIELQGDGKEGVLLQGDPVPSLPFREWSVCDRCLSRSTVRLHRGSVELREGTLAPLANHRACT